MYVVRRWAVRQSRLLEFFYNMFSAVLTRLDPLWRRLGYDRIERPMAAIESIVKGFLFDCRMCGQCVLSHTGMACPMNCPKSLRNGPCGGVRAGGMCEVEPAMRCVWAEAWDGASRMRSGGGILELQSPVDNALKGTSSWLRVARETAARTREEAARNGAAVAP